MNIRVGIAAASLLAVVAAAPVEAHAPMVVVAGMRRGRRTAELGP